jgi:hypothetical protein
VAQIPGCSARHRLDALHCTCGGLKPSKLPVFIAAGDTNSRSRPTWRGHGRQRRAEMARAQPPSTPTTARFSDEERTALRLSTRGTRRPERTGGPSWTKRSSRQPGRGAGNDAGAGHRLRLGGRRAHRLMQVAARRREEPTRCCAPDTVLQPSFSVTSSLRQLS